MTTKKDKCKILLYVNRGRHGRKTYPAICDFYKLHIVRELIWFSIFLAISIYVLRIRGEFDLVLILPLPMLLAIGLGWWQRNQKGGGK